MSRTRRLFVLGSLRVGRDGEELNPGRPPPMPSGPWTCSRAWGSGTSTLCPAMIAKLRALQE